MSAASTHRGSSPGFFHVLPGAPGRLFRHLADIYLLSLEATAAALPAVLKAVQCRVSRAAIAGHRRRGL